MQGLTTHQAQQLLESYGLNQLEETKKKHVLIRFFNELNNFLTLLLIGASVFSFFIHEIIDAVLIIGIVLLNGLFGLYQEAKAEEAVNALKNITLTKVRVIRNGKEIEIDSRYLVPGDLIFIEDGTKIPADGVLIESVNLELNEASLTGESMPVEKKVNDEVYSGTIVVKGRGYVKIALTGMKTKFGQIAYSLTAIQEAETPLQKKLNELTRTIGIVGIFTAVIVFLLSVVNDTGYFPAFLLAISLAVAVVPEGLPAVVTITLSLGVKEMSKKRAVVRKLSAIEALGNITLIATDKTGTLTTNKMKVKEIFIENTLYPSNNLPRLTNHSFQHLALNGILCSTASLVYIYDKHELKEGRWDVLGDPTEGALLYLAQEVGLVPERVKREWHLLEEEPFDSVKKIMSVEVKKGDRVITYTKGAPEIILDYCDKIVIGSKEQRLTPYAVKVIEKQIEEWARKGLRILGFSYAHSRSKKQTFIGMVAIHDAPREEVVDALSRANEAGIRVIMITGDNEKTAEAVGVMIGLLKEKDEVLTGPQIDSYSDDKLLNLLPRVKIFARTTPFHKHRIVKLYQRLGEVVAVTGDGVNDAIALKQADVGVAMGLVGTDVARETADMVITDDNFATIVNAVEEGRNIIKNLKSAIKYLVSCNITEAISLIGGLAAGVPTLFYPIQLLYINLVTDGYPALSLSFSPRNRQLMKSPPEKEVVLLNAKDKKYISVVGVVSSILVLGSYYFYSQASSLLAQTAAFSVLTLIQSFIFVDLWLSHQPLRRSLKLLLSPVFVFAFLFPFVTQLLIVKSRFISSLFKTSPVDFAAYLQFIFFASLVLVVIKIVKKVIRY